MSETWLRHFIGLDGEMSGTALTTHRLIEIGVAPPTGDVFDSMIGWPTGCAYEPEALRVIGRDASGLRLGPVAAEVDAQLVNWARAQGYVTGSMVPVGWGVSTFDLPFVVQTLPRFAEFLSHHTVELNALCYAAAGTGTADAVDVSSGGAFNRWRRAAKSAAEAALAEAGHPPGWHRAGYDARASLEAWRWLTARLATAQGPRAAP